MSKCLNRKLYRSAQQQCAAAFDLALQPVISRAVSILHNRRTVNMPEPTRELVAEQDGRDFYDAATGKCLATYPGFVRNDFDIAGAKAARSQFLKDFGQYRFSEVSA